MAWNDTQARMVLIEKMMPAKAGAPHGGLANRNSVLDHGSLTSTRAKDLGKVAGFADSWTTTRSQLASMEFTTGVALIATKEPSAKVLDRMGV